MARDEADHPLSGTQPQQGSVARTVDVALSGCVSLHSQLSIKARRGGRGRAFIEQKVGDDLHHATGKWNHLTRVVDREANAYHEVIVDLETGAVIREVHEPLSEHQGHGSAKPQSEDAP